MAGSPGKLRLEVKDEEGTFLFVSDGRTKWRYSSTRNQYTEEAARGNPPVSAGGRKETFPIYRSLLVERFRDLSQYGSTAVLEKDSHLEIGANDVACYVLKVQAQQGVDELWVDKDRYTVWKSRHVPPPLSKGTLPTLTINVLEAKMNTQLGKSIFHFTPPAKAEKVISFEGNR